MYFNVFYVWENCAHFYVFSHGYKRTKQLLTEIHVFNNYIADNRQSVKDEVSKRLQVKDEIVKALVLHAVVKSH